jgi:hypothetical protein
MTEGNDGIQQTGIAECKTSGRVGDIHVLGVLHKQPLAIARLTGAITRYDPDVVAVEASGKAIGQYHPDVQDARWPPRDEVEAAAFVTDRNYDLLLAAIDTQEYESTVDFEQLDKEIFTELGIIKTEEQLTRAVYHELDLPTIRQWRELTEQRAPDAFKTVISDRDERMAGHLQALSESDRVDTIVAAVGVQHLTGVLEYLNSPTTIPEDVIEIPPFVDYQLFPRDSPYSQAE